MGEDVHTTYVVCPKCKKAIYAASDFGFGPVWPAHMYYGNCLLLTVDFFSDNRYEITFKSAPQTDIMIPKRSKKIIINTILISWNIFIKRFKN